MKKRFNPQVSYFYDEKKPTIKRIVDGQQKEVANYPTTYETCISDPKHHKHYSVLSHKSLYNILSGLKQANKDIKGAAGSMFFFIDPEYTYHTKENMVSRGVYTSIGICGIDLDDMPEELAERINFNFWLYSSKMPQLYASYISHSKKGVHIIVRCKSGLNQYEYIVEDLKQTLEFVRVVKEVENIDLTRYIDTSSTSMSQRHHLSYCKYVPINEEAEEIELPTPDKIDIEIKEEYTEKQKSHLRSCIKKYDNAIYNIQHPTKDSKQLSYEFHEQEVVLQSIEDISDVVYLTYEQRWVLFSSLRKVFTNKTEYLQQAERICKILHGRENHPWTYYYDQAKRLLNGKLADGISVKYLNLFGYNVKNKKLYEFEEEQKNKEIQTTEDRERIIEQRKNCLSSITPAENKIRLKGKYLSQYEEDIIVKFIMNEDDIQDVRFFTIESPTGTGKTTKIIDIANKNNSIVLSPTIGLTDEYAKKLKRVEGDKDYIDDIGLCMTYDRMGLINTKRIHNKWIFIDESHVLFTDRTYRPALITLQKIIPTLVKQGCKIIFVSATPTEKQFELFKSKRIEFFQDRPMVNVIPVKVKSTEDKIEECVERWIKEKVLLHDGFDNKYNRTVIFSNRHTRRLYDTMFISQFELNDIMHADYPMETNRILKDNMLKKKHTMCTSIAYNGVNFLNKDEYIAVVSVVEDFTTATEIIQQCGRFRNSVIDLYLVYNNGMPIRKQETVKDKKLRHQWEVNLGLRDKDNISEDKYAAMEEKEEYLLKHNSIDNILKELVLEEYFYISKTVEVKSEPTDKNNPIRISADKYIKENFSTEMLNYDYNPNSTIKIFNTYVKEICSMINTFFSDQQYNITTEDFNMAINKISIQIKSFLRKLKDIKNAINTTEEQFMFMESRIADIAKSDEIDINSRTILLKQLASQIKNRKKLHKKYINKSDIGIITSIVDEDVLNQQKKKEGNSNGGKKGKQIEITSKNGVVKTFKTIEEAAVALGFPYKTVSRWVNKKCKPHNGMIIRRI